MKFDASSKKIIFFIHLGIFSGIDPGAPDKLNSFVKYLFIYLFIYMLVIIQETVDGHILIAVEEIFLDKKLNNVKLFIEYLEKKYILLTWII